MTQLNLFSGPPKNEGSSTATVSADITFRKHGGQATSVAANKRSAPVKENWRQKILRFIEFSGEATLLDACIHFNKERGQLSGRFSELHLKLKVIEICGERNGFHVYKVK